MCIWFAGLPAKRAKPSSMRFTARKRPRVHDIPVNSSASDRHGRTNALPLPSLPAAREYNPARDAANMEHLVAADQNDRVIGRALALLENLNPPPNGNAAINEDMEQAQNQTADPPKNQTKE